MSLADRLAALHAASFPDPWDAAAFDALLAKPTTHAVTTDHGFALLQVIPPEAEVITLSIRPEARRQGQGRALLRQVFDAAQAAGAAEIFLEVDAINRAARALYAAAGFTEVGRRPAYYAQAGAPATDALLLRCDLTAQSYGT